MARGKLWTTLEERRLIQMLQQGIKYGTIAKVLNRPYGSISGRITRHRLPRGYEQLPRLHKPGELMERVRTLCIPGVPDSAVADILGVTRTAIKNARKRISIPPGCKQNVRQKKPQDANISDGAKVIRLYAGVGRTTKQICDILNLPYFTIQYYLRKYNLEVLRKTEYTNPDKQRKLDREANIFKPRVYSIGRL